MIASPITNGGVMMGRTDKTLKSLLNLKFVLATNSANPNPKKVDERAVKAPMVKVFQTTPQPTLVTKQSKPQRPLFINLYEKLTHV